MSTQNKLYLSALIASLSHNAYALDPASIDFEGLSVTPTVSVAGSYDDNYLTLNDDDKKASWIIGITPSVNIVAFGEKSTYELNYTMDHKRFNDLGASNLTSHFLDASANFAFDVRNNLNLGASINKTQTVENAFTIGELNDFTTRIIGANYIYGAPSATGNIELGVSRENYRSNNDVNIGQERDSTSVNAVFVYKITDKTKLTAEARTTIFDYLSNDPLDSRNRGLLIGARWEATSQTTGFAKLGREIKDFEEPGKDNTSLTTWEVSADWAPKTYSVVTVTTNQRIDEGNFGADYSDTRVSSINWRHDWGRGYSSNAGYALRRIDYSNDRLDDRRTYNVGLTYLVKRWVDLNLDYRHINQASTDEIYDYERNVVSLSVDVSL